MSNNSNGVPSGEPDHVTQFLQGAFGRIDLGLFAPAQSCWFSFIFERYSRERLCGTRADRLHVPMD